METRTNYECVNAAVIEPEELYEAELDLFEKGQTESYRDLDVNPDLSETQKWQVQRLIEEFQDIFTDKPRITNLGEHEIKLTAEDPIFSKPYGTHCVFTLCNASIII